MFGKITARFRESPWLGLICVLLAAGGIRSLAIHRSVAPARDALRYLSCAADFEELPFVVALRSIDSHPLYPMSLVAVHWVVRSLGFNDATHWVTACQIWSTVCYLAFLTLAYAVGRGIWNDRIALLGCMALAFVPRQVFYSVDILSDSLHAALWMASLLCFLNGWRSRKIAWFASAGVLCGLAYWTRMEAVLLPMAFAGSWLLALCSARTRLPIRFSSFATLAFVVGIMVIAVPYVAITGKLSPRNSTRSILGESTVGEPVVRQEESLVKTLAGQPLTRPYDFKRSVDENVARGLAPAEQDHIDKPNLISKRYGAADGYSDRTLPAAVTRFVYELSQETRGWILAMAVLTLFHFGRTRASMPGVLVCVVAFCGCAGMLVVLQMKAGYMAGRYLTPVLPFVCMTAIAGVESLIALVDAMPRLMWERSWTPEALATRRRLTTCGILAATAFALCIPDCLRPLHPFRRGHMQAAAWIRQHTATDELIFDPSQFSGFFADRPIWKPSAESAERPPIRYAVIDPSVVYRTEFDIHRAIAKVNELGRAVAKFDRSATSKDVGVYIFELPNPPARIVRTPPSTSILR